MWVEYPFSCSHGRLVKSIGSEVKWKLHSCVQLFVSPWIIHVHGLYSPWNSPGQNAGVGSLSLLQGIFPTQGSNPGLLHCNGRQVRGHEFICKLCGTFTVCWWPSLLVSLNFFPFLEKHKIMLFFKFSSRIKSHIFETPWPISNTKCYFNCSVLNTVTSSLSFFLPKSHTMLLIWCLRHQATL